MRVGGECLWHEHLLTFQRTARDARFELFKHDALVERVLVDDDQPVVAFGNEGSCCATEWPTGLAPEKRSMPTQASA